MLSQQNAIKLFEILVEEARKFRSDSIKANRPKWDGFEKWRTISEDSIAQVFGEGSRNLLKFQAIRFVPLVQNSSGLVSYVVGMDMASEHLEGMLWTIRLWWQTPTPLSPQVFISCSSGARKTLAPKLKELLLNLSATPIIVEEMPDLGLSVQAKVDAFMSISNMGIVILTGEDITKDGNLVPRGNVDHEVGMMQKSQNIGGKIVYLKEKDISIPSNFQQYAWVEFDRKYFEKSFLQLIRDLKPFLSG